MGSGPKDMSTRTTTRQAGVDAIRVLGIIAVVVGHVGFEGAWVRSAIYTWHVPLFFFLTGYFWAPQRMMSIEMRKRLATLGLPYVAWLLLITAVFLPWWAQREGALSVVDAVRPFLGGAYVGRPYSAFWFISALFVVAITYRLMQNLPTWAHWSVALVGLAVAYAAPTFLTAIPLGAGVAFPSLIFVLSGAVFRRERSRFRRPLMVAACLLAASAATVFLGYSGPLDIKQADFGTPVSSVVVAIAVSISLILIGETVVPKLGEQFGKVCVVLAAGGTMVVLTHSAILWAVGAKPGGSWLDFLLALIIPWGAALVLARTPLSATLLGGARHPQK